MEEKDKEINSGKPGGYAHGWKNCEHCGRGNFFLKWFIIAFLIALAFGASFHFMGFGRYGGYGCGGRGNYGYSGMMGGYGYPMMGWQGNYQNDRDFIKWQYENLYGKNPTSTNSATQ